MIPATKSPLIKYMEKKFHYQDIVNDEIEKDLQLQSSVLLRLNYKKCCIHTIIIILTAGIWGLFLLYSSLFQAYFLYDHTNVEPTHILCTDS